MTNEAGFVGGIDSHKDTIHVAVITELGVAVDDREFCTTAGRIPGRGRLVDRPREPKRGRDRGHQQLRCRHSAPP